MRAIKFWSLPLVVAATIFMAAPCLAQLQPTHSNLTYAVVGGHALQLDLYIPGPTAPPGPYPLVIWIHGGAWAGGDKFPANGATGALLARGIALASINYRLTSQAALFGGQPVIFPAQIHDCKAAVRWLRANAATYNINPNKFGSWGSSAGGHLSALLGTSGGVAAAEGTVGTFPCFSSAIQVCADFFGPTDLLMMNLDVTTPPGSTIDHDAPGSPESHLLGWDHPGQGVGDIRKNIDNPNPPYPALVALANLANPITHIDPNDPPFLIVHGTADAVVPFNQSVRLRDALTVAGVQNLLTPVVGGGHGTGFPPSVSTQTVDFFDQEFDRIGTPPPPGGDLTGDGHVNGLDLAALLAQWSGLGAYSPCPPFRPGDLNHDCRVNGLDLANLLAQWTG